MPEENTAPLETVSVEIETWTDSGGPADSLERLFRGGFETRTRAALAELDRIFGRVSFAGRG